MGQAGDCGEQSRAWGACNGGDIIDAGFGVAPRAALLSSNRV